MRQRGQKNHDYFVTSYQEAIEVIRIYGIPNYIYFEHDLGVDKDGILLKTGYDLAKWMIDSDLDNNYKL